MAQPATWQRVTTEAAEKIPKEPRQRSQLLIGEVSPGGGIGMFSLVNGGQ